MKHLIILLLFSLHAFAGNDKPISCAPAKVKKVYAGKLTVKAGVWSDPSVWGGTLPTNEDVEILHNVTLDRNATVRNIVLTNAELFFDSSKSLKLQARDIWAKGTSRIRAKPVSASIHDTIQIIGVNEYLFKGGGMDHLDTDPGIWIMESSQLDLQGTPKTSWTTLTQGLPVGSGSFSLPPPSWSVNDQIVIAPSKKGHFDFSETTIKSIAGNVISFNPLTREHPSNTNPISGNTYYPEVMNVTRNIHIMGTPAGRAHLFIRSTRPQSISYTELRYMGPRKDENGDDRHEKVLGRYVMHFHHSMDGSRGSRIIGNVARDCGNHSFVGHMSNGILFKDNIAYSTFEDPYWWDEGHISDDITYDHNIAGGSHYVVGSKSMNEANVGDPSSRPPTLAVNGFQLGMGKGLIAINNCVVGLRYGDAGAGGAYNWEANNETFEWLFRSNIAHNNYSQFRNWQNTRTHHLIEKLIGYNGGRYQVWYGNADINITMNALNGAYANPFRFLDCEFFGGVIEAKAASEHYDIGYDKYGQIWDRCIIDTLLFVASPVRGEEPILVRNSTIGTLINNAGGDAAGETVHGVDVVNTKILREIKMGPNATANEFIRFQDATQIYKLTKSGKVTIPTFNFDVVSPQPPTPVFKNVVKSQTFTRNNCATGEIPGTYVYTVQADKYTAASQIEADRLAQNEIDANGQHHANMHATCTPVVVPPPVQPVTVGLTDVQITVKQLKIFSPIVQSYSIRTVAGSTLRAGTLQVGDNIIDIQKITQTTIVVRIAGKNYTVTR